MLRNATNASVISVLLNFSPSLDPFILPHQQVDKGAIKFVLSGANIMCPGLTSPGAKLYPAAGDTIVVSFDSCCLLAMVSFSRLQVSGLAGLKTCGHSLTS